MITAVTRLYRDMGSGAVRIGLAVFPGWRS